MSHAHLPATSVINACKAYIKARNDRISQERSELIESHVGRRAWFGLGRPATREEVEAEFADEIDWIKITGSYWHDKVVELQSLATMAEKSNTSVVVDAEVARLLEPHFG